MIRSIIILVFLGMAGTVSAQQLPYYSQYMYNKFYLNPAVAGTKSYNPAILTFRSQWAGFKGAPKTQTATFHGQLMENMGAGMILLNDNTGPLSQTGIQMAYSYHIQTDEKSNLALGLSGMLYQHVLNYNEMTYVEENDVAFMKGKERSLVPDAAFGAWYFTDDYYAGLSVPQLFHTKIKYTDAEEQLNRHVGHFYLTGGYKFELNEDFDLEPSLLLKAVINAPVQADINIKSTYKDLVWLGTSYRHGDALVLMLGLQKEQFFGGYSYDATLSGLRKHSSGSHEIFLGMNIPQFDAQRNSASFQ